MPIELQAKMEKEVKAERKGGREALLMALVGLAIGFFYSVVILWITPVVYESSVIVEFRKPSGTVVDEGWSVANEVAFITSPDFSSELGSDLDPSLKKHQPSFAVGMILNNRTKVEAVGESDFQKITVSNSDATVARDIAAEIPTTYLRLKSAQRIEDLDLKRRKLANMIQNGQDLIDESDELLRLLLADVGLNLSRKNQLEQMTLSGYFEDHPEKWNAMALKKYQFAWQDYSSRQDGLKALQNQKTKIILAEAESYTPVKVHGRPKVPLVASYPIYKFELLLALLKGLIFGLVLGAATLLFFRVKRKGENDPDQPIRSEADPGDVWA